MVLLQDLSDDTCALGVRSIGKEPLAEHRVQHSAVNRLQTVSNIGKSAADDHRHRVVHVGLFHLVFDVDRQPFSRYDHVVLLLLSLFSFSVGEETR